MHIVAISDVHNHWGDVVLPEADVLIIAGDLCEPSDQSFAGADRWLASSSSRYGRVLYVPGNHDEKLLEDGRTVRTSSTHLMAALLADEEVTIDNLRFFGMPYRRNSADQPAIPLGLDVLITHEPPYGILDFYPQRRDQHGGSVELRDQIRGASPRLHIFGHCHRSFGTHENGETVFVNVSICGHPENYYNVYHPATSIVIDANELIVVQ